MFVYKLTNQINNKGYIGITENISRRLSQHKYYESKPGRYYLHNAFKKYGFNSFKCEVLYEASSKEELGVVERGLIAEHGTYFPNGYNLTAGGEGLYKLNAPAGENNHQSKLTREVVIFLRSSNFSDLSNEIMMNIVKSVFSLDISIGAINQARAGRTWKLLNIDMCPIHIGRGNRIGSRGNNRRKNN